MPEQGRTVNHPQLKTAWLKTGLVTHYLKGRVPHVRWHTPEHCRALGMCRTGLHVWIREGCCVNVNGDFNPGNKQSVSIRLYTDLKHTYIAHINPSLTHKP